MSFIDCTKVRFPPLRACAKPPEWQLAHPFSSGVASVPMDSCVEPGIEQLAGAWQLTQTRLVIVLAALATVVTAPVSMWT
ncbi:MAG: hypothetical protein WCR59_01000 [Planctomycetota bacterium]